MELDQFTMFSTNGNLIRGGIVCMSVGAALLVAKVAISPQDSPMHSMDSYSNRMGKEEQHRRHTTGGTYIHIQ